jgi:hypothetical protein
LSTYLRVRVKVKVRVRVRVRVVELYWHKTAGFKLGNNGNSMH